MGPLYPSRAARRNVPWRNRDETRRPLRDHRFCLGALWLGLLVVAGAAGCARNPVTGRPEAVLTSEEAEIEYGNQAAEVVRAEMGLVDDPALEAYVAQLGQRLAAHSPRSQLDYRFQIIDLPEANAFALPGGHVYVSRGLLSLANSEDELAAVLGHEIGHIAARHAVRRQTASAPLAPLQIAAALGGVAASIVSPNLGQIVAGIGQLPGAYVMAAYSREQEREADRLGQELAAAAGFDPMALSLFTRTLAREEILEGDRAAARPFLLSHPPSPERSAAAEAYAGSLVIATGLPAPLDRDAFLLHVDGLVLGQSAAEGVFIDERFLHPGLGVGFTFPGDWKPFNARNSVSAISPDGSASLVIEIVGEGSDPMETAREFGRSIRLDEAPEALQVNGLAAARSGALVRGRNGGRQLLLTWVAHDDLIYRIAGVCPLTEIALMRPEFRRTTASFHPLAPGERNEISETRLRVVVADPGEDLSRLGERSGNEWTPPRTAIANGLEDEDAPLSPGWRIKIAHAEPYEDPQGQAP